MPIQQRSVYTEAEERGARLNYILCDTATRTCLNVFHQHLGFPENPTDLFNRLQSPQIFAILIKLKKPPGRVITQEQWDLLFPPIPLSPATDSHTFDITLWCILLRSICNLPAPSNGWDRDPNANDNTLSANLVRLRLCRNRLRAHVCSTSLSETEFNRYWQEVEDILIVLGCPKAEIDSRKIESLDPNLFVKHNDLLKELKQTEDLLDKQIDAIKEDIDRLNSKQQEIEQNQKIQDERTIIVDERFNQQDQRQIIVEGRMDQQGERLKRCEDRLEEQDASVRKRPELDQKYMPSGMAFSNHIPLKSNQFTGRDKDMKYLLQTIENNQLIVITGSPGIGKTTFAIQVAHELLKDNSTYLIQFIDLRCIDSIETITAKIFQCFSKIPEDRPAQQLCNFLRSLKRAVVLLFDNSEDALTEKLKEQYFGLIKQILVNCPSVKVLCTSREKFGLLGVNSVIQVLDALENDDATSLLQSSVPHLGNENARKLANACGCAPLALTIISYLIRDDGIDSGRLIKEIDPNSSKSIDGYRSESLPEQSQLGHVIDSSYIRLTQEQQHAFCCLSIFPSAFNIKAAEFVLDTDDIHRTLAALNSRSLLSYDAALDRYSLHSYIRAFAKCKLDNNSSESIVKPRFAIYYARLLKDLAIKYYSGDFQPAVYKLRLEGPNIIKMLLSITEQNELYVEFKELADKFVVRFIYMFIPTEHFVLFYSELLKAAETRGDRKTSSYCYFCQAYHFRYIADFQKATDLLKLALSLGTEEGVLDEIDVAIFQSYLAWCYGMLKDYFEAKINLKYVTNFLDKKENKRDENQDLSMAFLLNISGNSCNVTGDIKNALEFGKKALELWRHFLRDHLEVARELYNMGIRLRKVTRSGEALLYLAQAQNIFDTVLGKCGETARNLYVMGRIYYDFQDYRKALQFLGMAAEIQETVNGCDSKEFKESYYLAQYIKRQLKE